MKDGTFVRVLPVFGAPAPDTYQVDGNAVAFNSVTGGYNDHWPTHRYRSGSECGFCLVIDGDVATRLRLEVNGVQSNRSMGELMQASEIHCMPAATGVYPWMAAKLKIYPALPANRFRMRQDNNQMAWPSPVFVD